MKEIKGRDVSDANGRDSLTYNRGSKGRELH